MANPIAVPGTNVPSGAAVSPGGAQGLAGTSAWTTCTSSFTIPAVGSTVSVPVVDTSWITTGEMIYVDQAGGTGQSGVLQVTAKAGNTLTLLNPAPAPAIPPADTSQPGLLKQLSGNTTDFVDGTNTCQNLVTAVQPTIWSARLRSFNAIGNPTFEVDQRNVAAALTVPSSGGNFMSVDRWNIRKAGTGTLACTAQQGGPAGQFVVPGTNFVISRALLRIALTAQQASLAAGDGLQITQTVEGPRLRELIGDVTSLQLLVRCTSPIKFGVSLSDSANAYSIVKLATIGSANTVTLVSFPNLPLWTGSGTFPLTPGNVGYNLRICLCTGTTNMAAANDIWAAGNFYGAVGQDSFNTFPVNTLFDLIFLQHESGALCTTPTDCPFQQNYDDCLRYYQKTYDYGTVAGTVATAGLRGFVAPVPLASAYGTVGFHKPLAKTPTMIFYNHATGAANSVRDQSGTDHASVSALNLGVSGFGGISFTTATTSANGVWAHFTADSGW